MWIAIAVALVVWVLLHLKTSRPDGDLLKIPKFRRMLMAIMPTRNESVVYFDRAVDADRLVPYLEAARDKFGANLTHALVAAFNIGLAENPKMNQFSVGGRLYRRKGRWISFSMKRKKLNRKAKLAAVKLPMVDGETFRELTDRINGRIDHQRSGEKTSEDKEFDLLDLLPRPLLYGANRLIRWLDYYNLLPAFFIEGDGMFTSIFIANLGSLGMGPGYHHLYEHGTCPLFVMAGVIEERAVVVDGEVVVKKILPLRFSYEERIADGLDANYGIESTVRILENPDHWLGCLADDGSDARPMWPHGEELDVGDVSPPGGALG